jgi:putative nucleotidyltransferase with HDIG domain
MESESLNLKDMVAVPVEHFFSGLKTEVDVYIQLSEEKFVMITKAGESFELDQLQRYQGKHLSHLYIKTPDYQTFLKKQISIAGIVLSNAQFTMEKKTNVVSKVAESIYQSIQKLGLDESTYEPVKEISSHVTNLVEADVSISNLLESLQKSSEDTLRHSVAVSFVAPMIGKKMDWGRTETLEKLCIGGLLHDIGEKELSQELKTKARADWSYDELKEYESHPYRGMMILSSLKNFPEDIISIVYEHHENSMGQGFPRKLWDIKIHPLARVVGLANIFCELTLKSPVNPNPKSPIDAVKYIEKVMGQPFNKEVFKALKALVKLPDSDD